MRHLLLTITLIASTVARLGDDFLVGRKQVSYNTKELTPDKFLELSPLTDVNHLRDSVREILIPRVVGTDGHEKVRNYIKKSLEDLNWSVKLHKFHDQVPIFGKLHFHNIIASLNPQAERFLILACHYDSKYMPDVEFLGATDSAVPCAMLLNLAHVLRKELEPFRNNPKLSLMLLFFDGEEAFKEWGPHDSIYGARHLAKKWEAEGFLDRIDMLVLLDLIGAPDPKFYSFFQNTESWYSRLLLIEERLAESNLLERYSTSGVIRHNPNRYFQPNALRSSFIEDDHIPFLRRDVPVLHVIPTPFPSVWHTKDDNETVIDYATTENIAKIIRVFTIEYLLGILDSEK
ncbi:glutaminyl-peptide cyclotransferase isoform X2 [Teleopsis dalmanni]|uniref:glutaminyl-peptide cyclotransferase isoform X2 n=1 Tax=Teleopsis dalmanni TaxID=139649 RepID=UPI0018CE43C9|nr:glutaminyl-peptide cyclotransferase isoform X2 [Teleopsis dalmanni]